MISVGCSVGIIGGRCGVSVCGGGGWVGGGGEGFLLGYVMG